MEEALDGDLAAFNAKKRKLNTAEGGKEKKKDNPEKPEKPEKPKKEARSKSWW